MAGTHAHSAAGKSQQQLAIALALTSTYLVAEIVGGLWTGSLALLADAGHMLTDAAALALALLAIRFAARPATPQNTYGFYRSEILAALLNAVALLLISLYILYEAWQRFRQPPEVLGGPMLIVAVIGLVVNLVSMRLLAGGSAESLNMRGAYLEVVGDMLGSIGVIVASLLMLWKGWWLADPLIGAGIGLFIVPRTWGLLQEALHVLMEGTPARLDLREVTTALCAVPGVVAVHDLHAWTLTSGLEALSAHVSVTDLAQSDTVLDDLQRVLHERFNIEHTTLQLEREGRAAEDLPI